MKSPLRRATDQGFTLTELLVVTVLFAIVGAIVTTVSVTGLHHQTEVENRGDAVAQARTALERVDRDIRSAYPLLAASGSQLVLREVLSSATRTVTYTASNGQLVMNQSDVPTSGGATRTTRNVLLRNLVATDSNPIFSFSPIPGYVAPAGSGVNASTCAMSGGTSVDPGCVGTITVHVQVQPPSLPAPVSISDNGTELRNAH